VRIATGSLYVRSRAELLPTRLNFYLVPLITHFIDSHTYIDKGPRAPKVARLATDQLHCTKRDWSQSDSSSWAVSCLIFAFFIETVAEIIFFSDKTST
jgi:hypothetical protein